MIKIGKFRLNELTLIIKIIGNYQKLPKITKKLDFNRKSIYFNFLLTEKELIMA